MPYPGPKLYAAQGVSGLYVLVYPDGSTFLHLDLSSALNIMIWTQKGLGGETGADWHIFSREHKAILRRFLRRHFPGQNNEDIDPIHSQIHYLDANLLRLLKEEENIEPFYVRQQQGDAVLIPAGCPHQVSAVLFISS